MDNLRRSVALHNNRPESNFARATEITELVSSILAHLQKRSKKKELANPKDPGNPVTVIVMSLSSYSLVSRALEEIRLRSIDLSANVPRLPGNSSGVSQDSDESSTA